MRRMLLTVAVLCALTLTSAAQQALPQFEVASVKLNTAPVSLDNVALNYSPGRFVAIGMPPLLLVQLALDLDSTHIELERLPDWVANERYDIVATTGGPKTQPETKAMLRRLLEDRFKLSTHVETRPGRVFHLVRVPPEGALGSDIRPSAINCDQLQRERSASIELQRQEAQQKGQALALADRRLWPPGHPCSQAVQTVGGVSTLTLAGTTMAGLANRLRPAAGGAVTDQTGLTGAYALTLRYSRPDRRQANAAADTPFDAPLLEAALREQLGLKLEPHEGTTEIVVIDHIERPTPN